MPKLFLTLGILAVSTAPLLIRFAQPAAPIIIASYRVLLAGIVLGLIGWRQWREIMRLQRRDILILVIAGFALGTHFGLWITSLALTSTTASVALVATQPIFAGLLGFIVLREGFRRQEYIGIAIAAIGTLILAGGDFGNGSSQALLGDALALGGAIAVPIYLLAGRALGDRVPLLAYLSCVNLIAGGLLLLWGVVTDVHFTSIPTNDLAAIIALALVPSVIGHSLLNHCVRKVPVHLVSLGILAEPIIAALSTWLAFGEIPTRNTGIGAIIIIGGIYVGFGLRRKA